LTDPPFKPNSIQTPLAVENLSCPSSKEAKNLSDHEIIVPKFNLDMNYFDVDKEENFFKSKKSMSRKMSDQKEDEPKDGIIFEEIVKKKSPWFHYNTRKLILYPNKIEYYDPHKNLKKGEILLNKNCIALMKDDHKFELFTPKRTYLFKLYNNGSKEWSEKINNVIEILKK